MTVDRWELDILLKGHPWAFYCQGPTAAACKRMAKALTGVCGKDILGFRIYTGYGEHLRYVWNSYGNTWHFLRWEHGPGSSRSTLEGKGYGHDH